MRVARFARSAWGDAHGDAPFHAADECVPQEPAEPHGRDGAGVTDFLWSIEAIVLMAETAAYQAAHAALARSLAHCVAMTAYSFQ